MSNREYIAETFEYRGYTVKIIQDTDPESPRDWSNAGTMVCWHSRYDLGDKHMRRDDSVTDWLDSLAMEYDPTFADRWDNGHFERMVGSPPNGDYNAPAYEAKRKAWREARHDALWKILRRHYVILPLGLYDHSGITMYVGSEPSPFDPGGWDSGQVGWIYCDRKTMLHEWGGKSKRLTKKVREQAEKCLQQEVETYDQYLRGDVYGFVIEDPDGEHIDSCWGFFGLDYCIQEAKAAVPDEPAPVGGESEDVAHEEVLP